MTSKTVLVVDDEFHIVNVISLKLKNARYEIVTASSGEEALQRIGEEVPDLMITDFSMPGMNGMELVKEVKGREETSGLPVIMLTARGQIVEEEDGLAKIDVLMSKPFSPKEILEQVKNLVGEA
jgi:DNA-binding response OmpR family regulator